MNTPILTATNVHKSFLGPQGPVSVLNGVDLTLMRGETLALTGESGSGKSTLLHLIGGLDLPDQGQINVDTLDITGMDDRARASLRRDKVSVIFQQFNLIPSLTVSSNIAFQARLAGRFDHELANSLSQRLGLAEHLGKYPEQLSGGQQQRVAIARTLATQPRLILADEPTGNLDEDTASDVLSVMLQLIQESGAGLLIVTHSTRIANQMDNHLILRRGRVA